jgi:hypothetical protein
VAAFLASSTSSVARRCLGGNALSCAAILDVDQSADPLTAHYTTADYPMLLETTGERWEDSSRRPIVDRCVQLHSAADCATAIRWVPYREPVPLDVRTSFVDLVLATGGADAFSRLYNAHGTVREQIAQVAGIPADSAVRLWQRKVQQSLPAQPVGGSALATMGWLALIALLVRRRPRCS